jgi:hypothetical protein
MCSRFLPVTTFPKGPVRYLCKTHWTAQIYECAKRRKSELGKDFASTPTNVASLSSKKRNQCLNPSSATRKQPLSKLRSISILVDSKEDAKKVFGQDKVHMGLRDVEALVGSNLALRLIPEHPLTPLSNSNFIICTKEQRKLTTTLWKTKQDPNAYQKLLVLLDISKSPPPADSC